MLGLYLLGYRPIWSWDPVFWKMLLLQLLKTAFELHITKKKFSVVIICWKLGRPPIALQSAVYWCWSSKYWDLQVKALYVKNIPENTTTEQLKELFQRHGDVTKVVMPPGKAGKRDFGFIHYADRSSALKAIKETEKYEVNGNFQTNLFHY